MYTNYFINNKKKTDHVADLLLACHSISSFFIEKKRYVIRKPGVIHQGRRVIHQGRRYDTLAERHRDLREHRSISQIERERLLEVRLRFVEAW